MKKTIKISLLLLVCIFVVTGCSDNNNEKLGGHLKEDDSILDNVQDKDSDKEKEDNSSKNVLTCTKSGTVTTGVQADLTYQVTHDGTYVEKVHTVEKLMTDNEAYLQQYRNLLIRGYAPYQDVEYYDYDVRVDGDTLTSIVDINYSKIDTDKMIEINEDNATLIKNGKVLVSDIETLYKQIGAVCK